MINVYVLNPNDLSIMGIIEGYVSLIWRPAYYDIGDFELYMGATKQITELLKKDVYLVRDIDVSVVGGVVTYRNVMIVKNIDLITDIEDGDFLNVTGRELKFLLHSRIVWNQTNLYGNVENALRTLVNSNAINPTNPNRIIPNMALDKLAGISDTLSIQITGDYLDESIVSICTNYYIGWEIYISSGKLLVRFYKGEDRSYGQSQNPYVVFSDSFDNLFNTEYQLHTEEYANCTLIGGEGEGTQRIYTTIGNEYSGLNRFEHFTDARDSSQNKDSDEAISDSDYLALLVERGYEALAELAITEGFSGEVKSEGAFVYGTDFFIGDTVTVINKYGIQRNVSVLSAIESTDENGTKLIPQFNI